MLLERQAKLLTIELEASISDLKNTPTFYQLVKEGLSKVQQGLIPSGIGWRPWPLLPLLVCQAVCGRYEQALPAAASLQLFRASAEIFDDIEDADKSTSLPAKYGRAITTNVATAFVILAEKVITRLELTGVNKDTIIRVIDVINSHYTSICAGQHLDITFSPETAISEDSYLSIVAMKSASAVECACQVGALIGNASEKLIDAFGKFGQNLGIASQIANDILDTTNKNDIINRKITLPVIYALSQTDGKIRHQLDIIFTSSYESPFDPAQIRDLLFNIGAIQYATIKMEYYKNQALNILSAVEREGLNIEQLQQFLK